MLGQYTTQLFRKIIPLFWRQIWVPVRLRLFRFRQMCDGIEVAGYIAIAQKSSVPLVEPPRLSERAAGWAQRWTLPSALAAPIRPVRTIPL